MNKIIYPAIEEAVRERETQLAAMVDSRRAIVSSLNIGTWVMAKEVKSGSKFNEKFAGPFQVIHQNQNGSYRLKNFLDEEEPFIFHIDHLIEIEHFKFSNQEEEHEVKCILDTRGSGESTEYLVKWSNSKFDNSWLPQDAFRSQTIIAKFLAQRRQSSPPQLPPSTVMLSFFLTLSICLQQI